MNVYFSNTHMEMTAQGELAKALGWHVQNLDRFWLPRHTRKWTQRALDACVEDDKMHAAFDRSHLAGKHGHAVAQRAHCQGTGAFFATLGEKDLCCWPWHPCVEASPNFVWSNFAHVPLTKTSCTRGRSAGTKTTTPRR